MAELRLVVQLAIGIVFLLSSVGKLQNFRGFSHAVLAYRVLPAFLTNGSSWLIVALESLVAAAHLTGYFLSIALPVGLGLMASFAFAVSLNLKRGQALPCYCFGGSEAFISITTLFRLGLIALGDTLLLISYQPVFPFSMPLRVLALGLFWSIFVLVTGMWFFGSGDVARLMRDVP